MDHQSEREVISLLQAVGKASSACLCTKINSINENTSKSNETITQKLNNMEFYQEYVLTEINGKSDSHSDKLDQILVWKISESIYI